MSALASLVGGELDAKAPTPAGLVDRPAHHRRADTEAPRVGIDDDVLDLRDAPAAVGDVLDDGEVEGANHRARPLGDDEHVGGIGGDGGQRLAVAGRERRARVLVLAIALVGDGEEADDSGEITFFGAADEESGRHARGPRGGEVARKARTRKGWDAGWPRAVDALFGWLAWRFVAGPDAGISTQRRRDAKKREEKWIFHAARG